MATHSSILAWKILVDRKAWQATVHGVARVGHDLMTKPPPQPIPLPGGGSSRSIPWNWTRVSCIAGGFFTNWAIREAHRGQGSKLPLLEGIIYMCYLGYFCKEWLSLLSYYFCLSFLGFILPCWLYVVLALFAENVLSSWCLRVLFAPGHVGSYFPDQWLNLCPLFWKVDS